MLPVVVEGTPGSESALARIERRGRDDLAAVEEDVRAIVDDVRRRGDRAVLEHVERLERRRPEALLRRDYGGEAALARLDPALRDALRLAAARIERYHERQRGEHAIDDGAGCTLRLRVRPLARVGVYAPGGKARYPSSVLMCAVPAKVAGVRDVVLATPRPDDAVLAAAHLAGVSAILDAGGAQAIAALAYGTESVPRVDKIVGPGNAYVACAKRLVFGDVAIDGIAGPSELLVLADESADPRLVAADLVSQAEHDEEAWPVLACTSLRVAEAVRAEAARQLETLPRRAIAEASLRARGLAFVVPSRDRLVAIADAMAPEHLSLHVTDAEALGDRAAAAGAILVGSSMPVAAGDYLAGPSHVLPTGGGARFASPLGVYDFVVRTSVLRYGPAAIAAQAPSIATLARAEGLEGHARAASCRVEAAVRPTADARPSLHPLPGRSVSEAQSDR